MPKTIHSPRHQRLAKLLADRRKNAGMTQTQVAAALGRHQPFITGIENGERRVDVIELLTLADIIGFDVVALIHDLESTPDDPNEG